jgi:hypothetical protein
MPKDNGPRISVNKLAEYAESKGKRQRQILRDQKFPEYKGMYYREAGEAVAKCLASSLDDTAILATTIHLLNQTTSTKTGTIRRINSNIDALEAFEGMLDAIDLKGGAPELGEHKPEKLIIQGVEISVRPEIVLRGAGKSGKKLVGALKVHFPKTYSLNTDAAGYVSALLQRYSEDHLTAVGEFVGADYCFVIDVGSKTVHKPVKSIAARLADIETDCQNIAALWPTITKDE